MLKTAGAFRAGHVADSGGPWSRFTDWSWSTELVTNERTSLAAENSFGILHES